MDRIRDRELLKRIARLVKQNKELTEQIRNLAENNHNLARLVNNYERKLTREKAVEKADESGEDIPDILKFKMVTVLFADIQGFAKLTDTMDSESMMDELDNLFFHFDLIVEKYKLAKIKTIGDSYMCAGGVPYKNSTNPIDIIMAAMEMSRHLDELKMKSERNRVWDMRIGIHTATVTATSIGRRRKTWDLKGDTVNIASRLGASCEAGKINISVNTYELVKEFFSCDYNGKIPVKYLGNLDMYYVRGIMPEISLNGQGIQPNGKFDIKFKLIQFVDLQEIILDKLERELPGYLYYHNVKHTIDVITEVELIGWAEGVTEEEVLLLKTAALFHDSGHTIGYDDHESLGCRLAREYLPQYDFSPPQIERVCELIMATQMPPRPNDLLEKIICDSDLDYLGRSDFIPVSNTLYEELREQEKIGSLDEWNRMQIKFISGHQYFTETARNLREVNKQKQINRIKSLLEQD